MIRIGYDAKRAFKNGTGLGNYSRFVISAMLKHFPENEYHAYSPSKTHLPETEFLLQQNALKIHHPSLPFFTSYWRSKGILKDLKRDEIQLYHGLSHELPLGIQNTWIKSIVTIHDLIFLRYPEFYSAIDRNIYATKFRNACKNANHIIAVSDQTKQDVIDYFDINSDNVTVVYPMAHPIYSNRISDEEKISVKNRYDLPPQFLLSVGTIEDRKNLMLILKAMHQLPPDLNLVVVGRKTKYAQKVMQYLDKNNMKHRVLFLENAPTEDLPALYQLASVFIFPSYFEGFGLPILEALLSGTPVIAATGSCLEEAGGPDSIYIHPDDFNALAVAIQTVLADEYLRSRMILNGVKYAYGFSEQHLAEHLMAVYKKVIQQ